MPWFWGYKNRWGTVITKVYHGDISETAITRVDRSIIAVAGPFEAMSLEHAQSLIPSKLSQTFAGKIQNEGDSTTMTKKTKDAPAPEKPPKLVIRKTSEFLKCEFTPKQLEEFSQELALKFQELNRTRDEKKSVASSYDTKLKNIETRIQVLSDNVSTRSEMRSVRCEWHMNTPAKGKKTLYRTDSGEVVRIDEMMDSDFQLSFDEVKKDKSVEDKIKAAEGEPVDTTKPPDPDEREHEEGNPYHGNDQDGGDGDE